MKNIKKQINIWVDDETYRDIKVYADSKRVSVGWIAREALRRCMPKKKGRLDEPKEG